MKGKRSPRDERLAKLEQRLRDVSLLAQETIERIRPLAGTLHPPAIGVVSLSTVLEGYCRGWGQRTGAKISYRRGEVGPISDDRAIAFYRFLQEVLLNAERHADAEHGSSPLCRSSAPTAPLSAPSRAITLRSCPKGS